MRYVRRLRTCPSGAVRAHVTPGSGPAVHQTMTLIVGVTGGIGCGKTTVTDLLAARGASVVDTDAIAHQLTGGTERPCRRLLPRLVRLSFVPTAALTVQRCDVWCSPIRRRELASRPSPSDDPR